MVNPKFKALWDFISLSGGELASKVLGILAFSYLARILSPESYGHVELAAALLIFFTRLAEFGFGPVGARQVANYPDQALRYSTSIITARLVLVCIFVPLMCIVAPFMTESPEAIALIVVYSFALLPIPWNQRWLLQGLDHMKLVSMGQMLRMLVFVLVVVLFVRAPEDLLKVGYAEIAAVVFMLLYFLGVQLYFGVPVRLGFRFRELVDLGRQSAAIGLSEAVWAFNQYVPLLMLSKIAGAEMVAWFGAALRIVTALMSFSALYYFNLYPAMSQRFRKSRESLLDLIGPSCRITAWGGSLIALIVTLYAEPIIELVFGPEFPAAATSLSILIWALPLTLLSGHARWMLVAAHKQRFLFYAQFSAMLVTLVSGLLLIPRYGAVGASLTILLANIAVWVVAHFFAWRKVIRPPVRQVVLPAVLSLSMLVVASSYPGEAWYRELVFLATFILLALLMDRSLYRDAAILLQVKHVEHPDSLQQPDQ